jgi:hypothetical protein
MGNIGWLELFEPLKPVDYIDEDARLGIIDGKDVPYYVFAQLTRDEGPGDKAAMRPPPDDQWQCDLHQPSPACEQIWLAQPQREFYGRREAHPAHAVGLPIDIKDTAKIADVGALPYNIAIIAKKSDSYP